jgi:leader peptidase (prepilin peptidase)/N-methyltransferase
LQNIPVLSWLLLGGRCRSCKARISARYPLVELFTAVLSAAVAWKFGFGWASAAALVLTWFLVSLACIDIDTQLLPDNLTLPLLWLGLLVALLLPYHTGARLPVDLSDAVIGAMAGYLALWSVYHLFRLLTGKEGMGYGDFKLLAALGAWLGWQMLLPIVIGAAGVGAVVGIAAIVLKARDKGVPMAFGPYLAAAGWLALMFGPELVGAYFGLYAPR